MLRTEKQKKSSFTKLLLAVAGSGFVLVSALVAFTSYNQNTSQNSPPIAQAYTTGCLPWSGPYQYGTSNRDIVGDNDILPPNTPVQNTANTIKGTLYEDIAATTDSGRYGYSANEVNKNYKIKDARVELYDPATTKLISTVNSGVDGVFQFDSTNTDFSKFSNPVFDLANPATADCGRFSGKGGKAYIVRVVLASVKSPRVLAGNTSADMLAVPTYSAGCGGSNNRGAWSNKYKEDFGPGTVGQVAQVTTSTQIFQSLMVTTCDIARCDHN